MGDVHPDEVTGLPGWPSGKALPSRNYSGYIPMQKSLWHYHLTEAEIDEAFAMASQSEIDLAMQIAMSELEEHVLGEKLLQVVDSCEAASPRCKSLASTLATLSPADALAGVFSDVDFSKGNYDDDVPLERSFHDWLGGVFLPAASAAAKKKKLTLVAAKMKAAAAAGKAAKT